METMLADRAVATVLFLQALMDSMFDSVATRDARTSRSFNALWVPIVIVMAGAAAMTIWCTIRGYDGWSFTLTWPGFGAKCV